MIEKLLCIKKDNNVILYKISCQEQHIKKIIEDLRNRYSYNKKEIINVVLYKDCVISLGDFDDLSYAHVSDEYKVITEKNIDKDTKKCKIEASVSYDSTIADILEEVFLNNEILLDMTKFYKLANHIFNNQNYFSFDELIDLRNIKKKWNDPGRLLLNEKDKNKYLRYKEYELNNDDIKLNEREEKYKDDIYEEVMDRLDLELHYEQVGMFPIEKDAYEVFKIFETFGKRNEIFENYFYSIEKKKNCIYNMNGGLYIKNITNQVLENYKPQKQEINKDKKYTELIKSKLTMK